LSKLDVADRNPPAVHRHRARQQQRERIPDTTGWRRPCDVSLDGNGTGAVLYLDPYAFQETNTRRAAAAPRRRRRAGLAFNMVTRTGTNQFHGGAMFNGRESRHGVRELLAGPAHPVLAAVPAARSRQSKSCPARTS